MMTVDDEEKLSASTKGFNGSKILTLIMNIFHCLCWTRWRKSINVLLSQYFFLDHKVYRSEVMSAHLDGKGVLNRINPSFDRIKIETCANRMSVISLGK